MSSYNWEYWTAAVAAAATGAAGGGLLVERGLAQLEVGSAGPTRRAGRVAVALSGLAAVSATNHAHSWWLAPALLVWAYTLAAAATCDAATRRIPTPLVRQSGIAVAGLTAIAAATTEHWHWVLLAAVSATVAGLILLPWWRFGGAGFGDARLAVLGGLGLTHPTHLGLVAAFGAFALIIVTQAIVTLARGGNRQTTVPVGPALAAAFVVAAVV